MSNTSPYLQNAINDLFPFIPNSVELARAKYALSKVARIHEIAYQLATTGAIIENTFSDFINNNPGCFKVSTLPCAQGLTNFDYNKFQEVIKESLSDPENRLGANIRTSYKIAQNDSNLKAKLIQICENQTLGIAEEQAYCNEEFIDYTNTILNMI